MKKSTINVIAAATLLAASAAGSAFAGSPQNSHNSSGISTAQTHVTNPTASNVLGTINGDTLGRSFGSAVSGAASQNGANHRH